VAGIGSRRCEVHLLVRGGRHGLRGWMPAIAPIRSAALSPPSSLRRRARNESSALPFGSALFFKGADRFVGARRGEEIVGFERAGPGNLGQGRSGGLVVVFGVAVSDR